MNQIVDYYNPEKPQIYGIDNYENGNNCVFITHYLIQSFAVLQRQKLTL